MYYSQFGEDKILFEIFNEKNHGLCIEVGANDGINHSNTFYFEGIGWDCVLVEPNPELCQMIRAKRSSSQLYEFAATDRSGVVTLFVAEGEEMAHGVSTINSDKESLRKINSYGFTYKEVQVQTKTLDEILNELKPSCEIDFISIDVEGHELNVLKGFSIERWLPTVMLIEDNFFFEDDSVRKYMKQHGYVCFKRTGVNDWFADKRNKQLVNFYSVAKYRLTALKVKIKRQMKRIPGAVKFIHSLERCFLKSPRGNQ